MVQHLVNNHSLVTKPFVVQADDEAAGDGVVVVIVLVTWPQLTPKGKSGPCRQV